ncbi:MAG TPA: ACT domain-containing protein [Terriglobia bacterium]|jgi:hypothetical protein
MALAHQFTIQMENRRGALASLCSELAKVAVNISGIQAPEKAEGAAIRLVAEPAEVARKVLEQMQWKYREDTVVTAHLPDRPGALGKVTRKLAEKGIDILYAYGTIERGSERALIILGVSDPQAAAEVVK